MEDLGLFRFFILNGQFPDAFPAEEDPVPANAQPHPENGPVLEGNNNVLQGWQHDLFGVG